MADRLHTDTTMRAVAVTVLSLASAVTAIGCVERDPFNAYDVAAANAFHAEQAAKAREASAPSTNATPRGTVRCRCDEGGNLHVNAPQGSTVHRAEGQEDAEADITLPERRPGTPIRQTVSLGFIGDNKLTQSPSRGGPWNAPDGLLPHHAHGAPDHPHGHGYGYAPAGFFGYGAASRAPYRGGGIGGPVAGGAPPSAQRAPATVHTPGASYGGSPAAPRGGGRGGYGPR
ncbi:MAG: hypothetical protein KF819_04145 [Labilithrix sp.]|nr:hypothetical protein [Labilithrix sp.]